MDKVAARMVSIRTRHFCRVMQLVAVGILALGLVSIRTRHFCRVMPTGRIGYG